eukprot:scaffold271746_cov27-Tisochrysis_lutea.AAC.4
MPSGSSARGCISRICSSVSAGICSHFSWHEHWSQRTPGACRDRRRESASSKVLVGVLQVERQGMRLGLLLRPLGSRATVLGCLGARVVLPGEGGGGGRGGGGHERGGGRTWGGHQSILPPFQN